MTPENVPQHYQAAPLLFAGEYPFAGSADDGRDRLAALVARGVQTFLDLTSPHDGLTPYADSLAEMAAESGQDLRHVPHSIPDMSIPESPETMRAILDRIRSETAAGRTVYVHCWGGIGRTGTVIGAWFREQGLNGADALETVQRLYAAGMPKVAWHPRSPQTRMQRLYVERWTPAE